MNDSDFGVFFDEIHGRKPFPWQARLAARVLEAGRWPDILDLPTGSGKTACIDIALFHWFISASRGVAQRSARRIAFVVDRRIIVDEAAERARKIAKALETASSPVLRRARELMLAGAGERLEVMTLRGGIERENNLARDPTTLAVVLSTVDQLGSRLLFRGYGVSDRMKPIHAGLFGVDTLLLLDEAHIAEPFQKTLEGIVREQARCSAGDLGPKPLAWCRLSATPSTPGEGATTFSLDALDFKDAVLSRRLFAKKPMQLAEVTKRDDLTKKLTELVVEELDLPPVSEAEAPRIGVVVNRVGTARAVHGSLVKRLKDRAEVELVIGRVRPVERDERMRTLAPLLRSSNEPRPGDKPIVVVATQTIEVGADFDFHSLFIEAAGYSAIKQRLGRLNRLGLRESARGAIVLVQEDAEDDPIYGHTIAATWKLLQEHARDKCVDLGISAAPPATASTAPPIPATPVLSPSLLDLLVQTQPKPAVEPEVSEFLHGFETETADVSIVWRDGLIGVDGEVDVDLAREVLDALPPLSQEAMSLPFSTFRQWVRSWNSDKASKITDTGDLEGDYSQDEEVRETSSSAVIVVTGDDVLRVDATKARPGAKILLGTGRGGADKFGFAPESTAPVADLSLRARKAARRAATLVWTPALVESWLDPTSAADRGAIAASVKDLLEAFANEDTSREDAAEAVVADWFPQWDRELSTEVRDTFSEIRERAKRFTRCDWLDVKDERRGMVLRADKPSAEDLVDDEAGLQRTVKVMLADHSQGVASLAERFARQVGLSETLASALGTAGYVHDFGKADPRFQNRLGARPGELLAKSVRYDRRVATGERHEAYSVALLDQHPELLAAHPEHAALIRYLVGTHHGFGRGFHPVTEDRGTAFALDIDGKKLEFAGRPALAALASGWAELFVELNRAYGPWGLAYLEAILRLADHRRSEEEVTGGDA